MRITWEILEPRQIERVDREARKILSSTGMEVFDEPLVELLRLAGATVAGERVRFPDETVDRALQATPRTFSLYELGGAERPVVPGASYFSMYSDGLYTCSPGAQALTPSTKAGVAAFAALGQLLPTVQIVPNSCHARDVPAPVQQLHTVEALLGQTTKLTNFAPQNEREARVLRRHGGDRDRGAPQRPASGLAGRGLDDEPPAPGCRLG